MSDEMPIEIWAEVDTAIRSPRPKKTGNWWETLDAASTKYVRADEYERLRHAIHTAPCPMDALVDMMGGDHLRPRPGVVCGRCDCWKREALGDE